MFFSLSSVLYLLLLQHGVNFHNLGWFEPKEWREVIRLNAFGMYRWIPWWKLLLEYRVRMELTYITTILSVCIRDPKPTNHTVAHSWMWQNWIYNHFGFLHLLSGLLVRKSCFCSEDKVAASDASSSCTAIFWAIWSELHLTLAIYFELFTLGGDVYPSHPNHAVVIFIIYTNCEPAMMLFYLYNRISDAFRTIKREEGFSAFYRGIVPGFFLVCCLLFVFFLSILPP